MHHSGSDDELLTTLQAVVKQAGQEHLLADWPDLSVDQKAQLTADIQVRTAAAPQV